MNCLSKIKCLIGFFSIMLPVYGRAANCITTDCATLGYTVGDESKCVGDIIRCPYDKTKVRCALTENQCLKDGYRKKCFDGQRAGAACPSDSSYKMCSGNACWINKVVRAYKGDGTHTQVSAKITASTSASCNSSTHDTCYQSNNILCSYCLPKNPSIIKNEYPCKSDQYHATNYLMLKTECKNLAAGMPNDYKFAYSVSCTDGCGNPYMYTCCNKPNIAMNPCYNF